MDAAPPLGLAMTPLRLAVLVFAATAVAASTASADTYALIVSGASGGPTYATKYDGWRTTLVTTLKVKFGYGDDHVLSLGEATREQVHQAFQALRARMTRDDVLFVALIGHGTDDKFNLVGPDMRAADWAAELKGIDGRTVFVDTSSSSYVFFTQLSSPGRVVISANESAAQQFETVFPEFFVTAFTDAAADADKDGRVSMLEAFQYASAKVRTWFDQHNQLPTERALITEEAVARATFLQSRAGGSKRQADLESAIASLKARKSTMSQEAYDAELERLLTELARVSRP
ncbi:MAG TPA: hypothetical protein VN628_00065 [Vicinamibacterales bacterium]|nr:hypothetical protein [Vicinamibacterales bacterium]